MKKENEKQFIMEEEKVPKALLKLGIPTMIGMMTSAIYNLVDTFFVGTLGTTQTAAVSIAYPIGMIFLAIGLLFGSGASSYLSRLLGAKKHKEADICFSTSLFFSLVCAGIVVLLLLLILNPFLNILGATESTLPYARAYAIPFIIGLLFNVFNITMNNMIVAEGASAFSMITMLSGGIVNMILDPVFILLFHMGVSGAAYATLLSRLVSFALYIYYLCSKKSNFHFSFHNIKPEKTLLCEVFKIGMPMLIYQLLCSVAISVTNYAARFYGDSAIAGIGVANRILSLGSMILTGFLKGFQPFVGFNYGAKHYERVNTALHTALKWATAFSILMGIGMIVLHTPLIHLFTKTDTEMLKTGSEFLIYNAITFMGFGYAMVYDFFFLGMGLGKQGGMISMGHQGFFFLPLVLLLPKFFGLNGILLAQPIADLLTYCMILKMIWHKSFLPETIQHSCAN
ncbi:MATE family efflux transporter [Roseburia hominis]|uniref:MATE family efflux transporter n=1 Tax=Roseburia hominis TaxID=301301 RepID=UPI001F1CC659|nr:MATE family efflux transporter [Roseburia hominis]